MLSPKRVKHRKVQKGIGKGKAHKGTTLTYGDFGIQALEPAWITANQIESARITLSRYTKKVGKTYIKIFPDKNSKASILLDKVKQTGNLFGINIYKVENNEEWDGSSTSRVFRLYVK